MKPRALLGIGAALLVLGGIAATQVLHRAPASHDPAKPTAGAAKKRSGPVTTSGNITMHNMEIELADAQARAAADPADLSACLDFSRAVYMRSRVTGDIDEMARAVDLTSACVQRHPESGEPLVARASQAQSLHRFAEARTDLARAQKLGVKASRIASIERELDWAAGTWGSAAEAIRTEAAESPNVASVARLARLEHDLGHFEAADALYDRALTLVEDAAPIPVAMVEVQKGINLSDAKRLDGAEQAFRSAFERMPRYVAAKEHLAETLHRLGRDDEAVALYEQITKESTDPEFMGALASLYRTRGRLDEAGALHAKATARYEEMLAKYPEAMAWHASEYFAGEGGDKARARTLLQKNVALRPNPEALDALARAEREAGAAASADALTRRAETIRASAEARTGG